MPPIFGILNTRLKQPDPEMIRRMNGAARYIKPRRIEAIEVAGGYLATAVVAENPLVPGADTMAVSGAWVIAADASLYKRTELLMRMGRGGEGVRECDAPLILEAYLKWGEECLQYLYGDFAFVIFNQNTGEVFCGRDPLGVRPLFYAATDQDFIFASELRYLVAAFPEKPLIREEYLLDTLITVKTDKGKAPFENTFRLKPGHFLRYDGGGISESPYWSADLSRKIRLNNEGDYTQLFREKLVGAVTCRCEGVTALGAELSGGLDSSAVCGIAASSLPGDKTSLTAFSNVFPRDTPVELGDEREFIAEMLEFSPVNQVSIDRLRMPIAELLRYSMDIQGCFIQQNFNIFNQGIYEAAGDKGVAVLLSGFGGDELVSARTSMPWNELISDRQWGILVNELYYKGITLKSLLKPGLIVARYLFSLLRRPAYKTGVFTKELLDKRFTNLPLRHEFAASYKLRQRLGEKYRMAKFERIAQRQYERITQDHLPQRMEYCYAAAAQYGMEYRYPLLDVELVETCLAFPPWMKQHHGTNRYIFRQAIAGFVPEEIRLRDDKSGTTIPQVYYSLATEREAIMNLVNSCSGTEMLKGILDFSGFEDWYDRLVKRDPEHMNYLMPGAFYNYLMMILYYRDKGQGRVRSDACLPAGRSEECEIGILLKLLRGDASFQLHPGTFDTGRLIRLVERHRVVHALLRITQERKDIFTDEQRARIGNRCREGAMRSLGQLQELKRIAVVLNERGLGYACIKGPQLSRMIYGREALKESVDLDILLVHAADLPEVHQVFTEQGYTRSNLNAYPGAFARKIFLIAKREVHYFNPECQCAIDLHVRPGANTYLTAGRFKDLLLKLVSCDLEGTPMPVLPDEEYFVYLCYHGALHQFSRLAWLMDIRAFLQLKKNTLDYAGVRNIARKLRVERHVGLALHLLEDYFGDEIPRSLLKKMIRSWRMRFLVSNCRLLIGRDVAYGLSLRGRFGKLVYMMVLIRGIAGKIDLLYGIMVRMVAGLLKA